MPGKEQMTLVSTQNQTRMKTYTLLVLTMLNAAAVWSAPGDSVAAQPAAPSPWKFTTRMHSRGLFSYGGRLVSENPVMDLGISYSAKTWGFQFFKAVDLSDRRTPINFAFALVNRPFHIGKRLTITPSAGVLLEQFESIADHGSDAVVLITTTYRFSKEIALEHSSLAGNLVLTPEFRDWVNRLRLLYSKGHLDVTLFGWHNNAAFDQSAYVTTGASIFYSRLKLDKALALQAGVTGLWMATATEEETMHHASGVFITLGLSVN